MLYENTNTSFFDKSFKSKMTLHIRFFACKNLCCWEKLCSFPNYDYLGPSYR